MSNYKATTLAMIADAREARAIRKRLKDNGWSNADIEKAIDYHYPGYCDSILEALEIIIGTHDSIPPHLYI